MSPFPYVAPAGPGGANPGRILVVDDMATNRTLVKVVLRPLDYEIVEAGSGEEALDRLRREPFDAVLLDIIMPGMSGLEVCRTIREDLGETLLPVIMVTSMGSPDDVVQGMEVGATDYVAKFTEDVDKARVVHALGLARPLNGAAPEGRPIDGGQTIRDLARLLVDDDRESIPVTSRSGEVVSPTTSG